MPQDIDLRRIDLNLLIVFDAIYTAGNITRASQQLGMSQPTVSNALGRLRGQFDDPLFQRSEKGVTPTPFADGLIFPVRQALAILRDTLSINRDFDLANANRTFRLAMNDFTVMGLLPDLLNLIATRASGVRVEVIGQEVLSPMDALLTGEADIAVDTFAKEISGVNFLPLHIPQGFVAARRSHPILQGTISKQQFSSLGHVALRQDSRMRAHTEAVLLSHGVTRRIICEVSNCIAIPSLITATDLIAVLPGPFARNAARHYDLQILPLPFPSLAQRLQIATLADKGKDTGIEWLCQQLHHGAKQNAVDEHWLSPD